jgi:hypothetical protein
MPKNKMSLYQVFDTLEELNEQLPRLSLRQLLLHDNVVEELALGSKFKYEVDSISLVERVFQTEDIGVGNTHQHGNFLLKAFCL